MNEIIKILKFTSKFKKYYFVLSIFIIVLSLLGQASPLLTKQIVDLIVNHFNDHNIDISNIYLLLGLVLLSEVLITVLSVISQYIGDLMSQKLNNYLSQKYYRHVLSLSVDYFDNEMTGRIVNRLDRGIISITNLIQQFSNSFLPFFVTTFVTLVIIAIYSWELAILLALLFPIYIYISHRSTVLWRVHEGKKNDIADITSGRVFEAISSIRVVKSFIREKIEYVFFKKSRQDIYDITKTQSKEWHRYDFYRRIILDVIMFAIFGYIIYFTFKGRFSLGEMTLLLQLSNQAKFPLFAMSFIISQIQQAQAGSKDFFAVLATKVSIEDKNNAKKLTNVKGDIEYKDLSFSYKSGSQVLNNISFRIPKGKKLAIVGESGEGKSTIANLLLRFYEPQEGEIKIDGVSIADVTQKSLRENIGVVFQDTFLFSGTIKDNISYGSENVDDEKIIEAARIANADEFITKLSDGYNTQIGERGIKLSGGQKQRIAIARALLKNPPILIFDEATSSLDSKAEFEVQKALNKLMEGRSTLIIAHRLSTIKDVDYIVVIKGGVIVEEGNPHDLEKRGGVYSELLSYQNMGKGQEKKLKEFNLEVN